MKRGKNSKKTVVTHIRNANEFNIIIVFCGFINFHRNPYIAVDFYNKENIVSVLKKYFFSRKHK
ncbi:MAG: hypothetical protein COA40_13630 [Aequorivita sp.]|nr:MAG: hypothetical protein COA40_13630 [Aequorivita sp.]